MSILVTEDGLWQEIKNAESVLNKRMEVIEWINQSHRTPHFDSGGESDWEDESYRPENVVHAFVSQTKPQVVFYDPRVKITSKAAAPEDPAHDIARGLQQATNRWIRDTRFARQFEGPVHDGLVGFGCVLVTEEDNPTAYGTNQNARWPRMTRISPRNFIRDPDALSRQECQFLGHRWRMGRRELIDIAESDDGSDWDLKAVREIASTDGDQYHKRPTSKGLQRDEIEGWDVWLAHYELEEGNEWGVPASPGPSKGFWGTIFTVSAGTKDSRNPKFLRKPRPYYGYRLGPYAWWDVDFVADDPYGLSPVVAVEGLNREWNRLSRAITREAERYRQGICVSGVAQTIIDEIESGVHNGVIPVARGLDLAKMVQKYEVGGLTDQMLVAEERKKQALDRNLGTSDAQRGMATKGATATAEAIADAESDARTEWIKKKAYEFAQDILVRAAWYIGTSKEVKITLSSQEAAEAGVMVPPGATAEFQGGDLKPLGPGSWDELELVIEPMSMGHSIHGAVQRRAMQAFELKQAAIPAILQAPIPGLWRREFERLGDALNIPGFAAEVDELVVFAQKMMVLQMGMEAQAAQSPSASSQAVSAAPVRPTVSLMGKTGDRNNKPLSRFRVTRQAGSALPGTASGAAETGEQRQAG